MGYVKSLLGTNFIEYASYVIKERAIPDINDGLKPVQRRILHSLYEVDDGKFNKVANIVGNTMKYHPHGDASIYSSLVVLANKDLFIDKQGNFGNIYTGDDASAARYIECRLSELAKEVIFNSDITEYTESYDGRNKEPVTLPAKIPVLLLMGAEGIAVGMSTKILPHNFNELLDAQIKIIKNQKFEIYPDFQQGGLIDVSEYDKGNGRVKIRAVIDIKDNKTLLIREVPFGTTTQTLINSIENAAKKGKVKINAINDFTAEKVEIELKTSRGESADDVIKSLYAYTDCELSVPISLIAIVNNKPKILSVNEVLKYNTNKLMADLLKELNIEKDKLLQKLHDLTLEQIFLENRIYKKIEELKTLEGVYRAVEDNMNKFKKLFIRALTKEDIEKLLQIKIRRISMYDIENYRKNKDDIVRQLKLVEARLADIKKFTIEYIENIKNKYGKDFTRKTKLIKIESIDKKEISVSDIKVYWDKTGGFLGTEAKGDTSFTVSPYEKFLVISHDFTYKVISIDNKVFIDTHTVFLDLFDENRVFSLIYTDLESMISYVKKFQIKKFITNRSYQLAPVNNARINYLSINPDDIVSIKFVKKKNQKVNSMLYDFKNLEIKGVSARGNKVSNKRVEKVVKK